jgi:uncharacterized membrane protein YqiK
MAKKTDPLFVFMIILIVVCVVGIILVIIFYLQYKDLVDNESKLCLTGSCAATSNNCGSSPFKLDDSGSIVCKPQSIFASQIPATSTGT